MNLGTWRFWFAENVAKKYKKISSYFMLHCFSLSIFLAFYPLKCSRK
jgi:hypothetical protein